MKEERIERNKKWRQKKEGKEILEDDEKELDDNEKRKLKNKEWRLKRESPNGSIDEKENDSRYTQSTFHDTAVVYFNSHQHKMFRNSC